MTYVVIKEWVLIWSYELCSLCLRIIEVLWLVEYECLVYGDFLWTLGVSIIIGYYFDIVLVWVQGCLIRNLCLWYAYDFMNLGGWIGERCVEIYLEWPQGDTFY